MTTMLDRALEIAREAHAGQVDKAGRPVIEHVLRVVDAVEGEDAKLVAALHDVLEDGAQQSRDAVLMGVPECVLLDLLLLRRGERQTYRSYIEDIARSGSARARAVKLADLRDHLHPDRFGALTRSHVERYRRALVRLGTSEEPAARPGEARDEGAGTGRAPSGAGREGEGT